jgi:hypothetical protein
MILFETTTFVSEIIWDIALALFIVRLALFYFGLTFLTGCILGYIRLPKTVSNYRLTEPKLKLSKCQPCFGRYHLGPMDDCTFRDAPSGRFQISSRVVGHGIYAIRRVARRYHYV